MHKLNAKTFTTLVALAIAPAGCFDPLVTEEPSTGSETDGTTSGSSDGSTAEPTTAVEPDSSSGQPEPVCGNGVVEGDEACDDGMNDGSYGGCNADCTAPGPFCGDGVINGQEPCDDGDDVDGNGCNVDCVVSGTVLWTVTYDGPDNGVDSASDVTTDSMGNVIVSGNQALNGDGAGWLRKYTLDGAPIWTVDVTSPSGDAANGSIASLLNDDIVFGGNYDTRSSSRDAWIWRYSAVGESVWTQTYSSPTGGWDRIADIDVDQDGNIYALVEPAELPTFVRKYLPDGTELWTQFHEPEILGQYLATDQQGRFVVAGQQINDGDDALWVQQSNSDGAELWTQIVDAGGASQADSLSVNSEGEIVLGVTYAEPAPRAIRLTPDGSGVNTIVPHPGAHILLIATAQIDHDGNVILGGSEITRDGNAFGWVSKYDADGTEMWTNTYDGAFDVSLSFDNVAAITTDSSGNVIAAGRIHDSPNLLSNVWLSKYAP